ncbi:hypothetical protein AB836_00125 [Rickettsiales bacterium (ex Bugula neritina AB1)]|nr:hypothetical protein AB836_00125 [Rickettsiales bacterium (ex Bugula neritina AB1)]
MYIMWQIIFLIINLQAFEDNLINNYIKRKYDFISLEYIQKIHEKTKKFLQNKDPLILENNYFLKLDDIIIYNNIDNKIPKDIIKKKYNISFDMYQYHQILQKPSVFLDVTFNNFNFLRDIFHINLKNHNTYCINETLVFIEPFINISLNIDYEKEINILNKYDLSIKLIILKNIYLLKQIKENIEKLYFYSPYDGKLFLKSQIFIIIDFLIFIFINKFVYESLY